MQWKSNPHGCKATDRRHAKLAVNTLWIGKDPTTPRGVPLSCCGRRETTAPDQGIVLRLPLSPHSPAPRFLLYAALARRRFLAHPHVLRCHTSRSLSAVASGSGLFRVTG
jgi:hypothetical protein